jgi:hypothetical protein
MEYKREPERNVVGWEVNGSNGCGDKKKENDPRWSTVVVRWAAAGRRRLTFFLFVAEQFPWH